MTSRFKFCSLSNIEQSLLIEAFNSAFKDYFVPISLDDEKFAEKMVIENIDLHYSVGAIAKGELAGFILTGIDNDISYNAGTGVLPEHRGQGLTQKMYEFLLPKLKLAGVRSQILEVITKNGPAIRTYEKTGFRKIRTLACFKGEIAPIEVNPDVEILPIENLDEAMAMQFWDSPPSWQNSLRASRQSTKPHKIVGAYSEQKLTGYIIYTTQGRVKQFAVKKDFRRRGIGIALFAHAVSEIGVKEIVITNIDCEYPQNTAFLERLGLNNFLEQYEMEMSF